MEYFFDDLFSDLVDMGVNGRSILECIFKKWMGRHGMD
jgi:hypothetical protein